MFYSASENRFYDPAFKSRYEASGTWPVDAIEVTEDEWQTYGAGESPAGKVRGATAEGRPTWVDIPPVEMTLEALAARKRAEIFASRDAAFAAGMDYTLPDGSADVVQTRPQDQINLLGLGIKAERLVNQGVTDEVMVIRGESNVSHSITPAEMVTLTDAALVYIEDIYQQGWDRKDTIDAALADDTLTDDEKRAALEAVTW
ncbi:tail fiber assembly protein [Halomonas getboli]|uniref:DUF4376 domain-containing protein n=1 Tax=Halomonas getboli TaxID=2935862 RepID=UPI0020000C1E|nr:tail fiber assembly protein [Halomonas getboli]MCK2185693.1 DUF4376 domain-containing protein [Halomonas getboli]